MAASKESNSAAANAPQRELVLTRVFDAPREVVFRAWTDPERLAQWWGPRGFTNPRCEWDARPGGAIRVDMTGPMGRVIPWAASFTGSASRGRSYYPLLASPA